MNLLEISDRLRAAGADEVHFRCDGIIRGLGITTRSGKRHAVAESLSEFDAVVAADQLLVWLAERGSGPEPFPIRK